MRSYAALTGKRAFYGDYGNGECCYEPDGGYDRHTSKGHHAASHGSCLETEVIGRREEKCRALLDWTTEAAVPNGSELFRDAVLFVLGAEDAVDRIRSSAAWFMIVANLHFAEQADGEQIQSPEEQA